MRCKFVNLSHIYKRSSFPNLKNELISTDMMILNCGAGEDS